MSEIRTNVTISGETLEYRSNIEISIVTLNSKLEDTHSSFRTNIDISTELNDGTISSIKTTLELDNISLDFYLVDMTKLNQSLLYFSKFFNMYFEPEVMWELLAQGTNEQINISHLSDALSNYVTFNNLLVINESLSNVSKILTEHINNNNRHLSEKERGFLERLMNDPSYGSGDSLFELIELKVGEDLYSWAVKPFEYKGNKVGIVSNSYISCLGLDTTAPSYGITRSDLFAILSGEPLDDSEYIDERFIKAKDILATKEWVYSQLAGISGGDIPPWVRDITLQQIQSWDLVASLFKLSEDDTYIYTTNDRGFVSHSFISCKGVDSSANQNSGITRSELFDILSNTPIDNSEYINLSFLDLSNYITKDEIVEYKGLSIDEADSRYASLTAFNILNTKVITFLESENLNDTIDRWKEVEDFLLGYTEQQTLVELLAAKTDKTEFQAHITAFNAHVVAFDNYKTTTDARLAALEALWAIDEDNNGLYPKNGRGIWSESYVTAGGIGTSASASGLIQTVYGFNNLGGTFSNTVLTDTFNAYAINSIYNEVQELKKSAGSVFNETALWQSLAKVDATKVIDSSHIPDLSSKYLSLNGGTLKNGTERVVLSLDTDGNVGTTIVLQKQGVKTSSYGHNTSGNYGVFITNHISDKGVMLGDDGELWYCNNSDSIPKTWEILHSGNIGSYALKFHPYDWSSNTYNTNDVAKNQIINHDKWSNAPISTIASLMDLSYSSDWRWQLFACAGNQTLYSRFRNSGTTWSDWKTIAFTDSNVASADVIAKTYTNQSINFANSESKIRLISGTLGDALANGFPARYTSGISVVSNYVGWQMLSYGGFSVPNPYYRQLNDEGVWGDWKQLAFLTDNVASATKLQDNAAYTAWGQTFFENGKPKSVKGRLYDVTRVDLKEWLEIYSSDKTTVIGELGHLNYANVYLRLYNGADLYLGPQHNETIIKNNGNVLIGATTDSGYKLDVNGGSLRLCAAIKSVNDTIAGFYTYPANPYGLQIRADTGTGDTYLQARREGKSEFFNLILQPDGGNVGINTPNPQYKLDVNGTLNAGDTTLSTLNAGATTVSSLTSTGNIRLKPTSADYGNYLYFGDSSYCYIAELTDDKMTIYASSGLQITANTNVSGNIYATGEITAGTASDRRLKNNIQSMTDEQAISVLKLLRPVTFNWNSIACELGKHSGYSDGFIADEYEAIIPNSGRDIWANYRAINYERAISYVVKGWQNHETRLERLERENIELRAEVKQLKQYRRT